ncbi:mitochondrial carrier [Polychaeton citri CBS 116435]|uniref:Mitochondrial glycine transporter n=1 Tax=Polychaeton citri CBS 116435 TaxID=1314669 RepID=A0A9P4QDF8_9PEZI|nr:mitochondrial carrier [Polychaeton citri CBS 116435]
MSDGGQKRKSTTSPAFHFLAGLGSGVTTAFLLQPADLLKTRVQQSRNSTLRQTLRDILNGPHPVRQLWRGTTPSVIRTGFGSALYFGMLNSMRQYAARMPAIPVTVQAGGTVAGAGAGTGLKQQTATTVSSSALPKLGNVANLATGALARVSAGFVMNPVTVLKVRYESSYYAYTSLLGAGRDIVAKEGMRGFFAGFGATAVRDAPYAGLYVLIYEQCKAKLGFLAASREGSAARSSAGGAASVNFLSGITAAGLATTLTNPFDAIKTRLQILPQKYGNMVQAARMMMREEGIRSMFDGLALRIGRKAISSALAWTVYEEMIRRAENVLV